MVSKEKPKTVGGQAVIEGVMMRSPNAFVVGTFDFKGVIARRQIGV